MKIVVLGAGSLGCAMGGLLAAAGHTVTLVNLVSETRVVPELLGPDCRAPALARVLGHVLDSEEAQAEQKAAMDLTMDRLGRGGLPPGLRAARSVLKAMGRDGSDA